MGCPLRPLLTQPRGNLSWRQTRGKGTADVLPSVAGHRAVKPSYVDRLELLDHLCQDPLSSLGKDGVNDADPTSLRRLRWTCLMNSVLPCLAVH